MDQQTAILVLKKLQEMHPNAHCELSFGSVFQLLVAVILSAQCTDKRVNEISKELFEVLSTPQQYVAVSQEELEKRIFSCGFYHNKAKNIKAAAAAICERFDGEVPQSFEELLSLPGVGRKTANVMLDVAFGKEAIAVDTHVFRVANRIGLADASTPEKTELALRANYDSSIWGNLHHLLIFHGRYVCHSQKPQCDICNLKDYCKYYAVKNTKK